MQKAAHLEGAAAVQAPPSLKNSSLKGSRLQRINRSLSLHMYYLPKASRGKGEMEGGMGGCNGRVTKSKMIDGRMLGGKGMMA